MTIVAAEIYQAFLLLHILAAMVWVGGALAVSLLAGRVLRDRDNDAIARFIRHVSTIGPRVFAPAVVLVIVFGLAMVINSDAWDFDQTWVRLALALFAVAFLIGAAQLSRSAIGAQRAADTGNHTEAARHLRRWLWGYRAVLLVLTVDAATPTNEPSAATRDAV